MMLPARTDLFALPLVGRAGLGNGLFPWARAELFARATGACVLAPRWGRLRVGPLLRREPDKRRYAGMFEATHHVDGIRRLGVCAFGRRVAEERVTDIPEADDGRRRPYIVEFSGTGRLFEPLLGEHEFIRGRLWRMTSEALRATGNQYGGRFIAMHVRRGDITRQGFTRRELDGVTQYTPLSWFVGMAGATRRSDVLRAMPIVVFTDGGRDEVAELCSLEGVQLHERKPAIADLWTISHASVLFASGFSTFSMWASYLGGMPTVYAPGKIQQRVQAGRTRAIEVEVADNEDVPHAVIAGISDA